jgi:hypothetical protein
MKRTEPTVSLLARKPDGTYAREYTPASHTDLKALFLRLEQDRQRATLERENVTQMSRSQKLAAAGFTPRPRLRNALGLMPEED